MPDYFSLRTSQRMPRRAISLEDINTVSAIHRALLGQEDDQDEGQDQDQDQDLDSEQGHHPHEQYPGHDYHHHHHHHHHQEQNHPERTASAASMPLSVPISSDTRPSSLRHPVQHLHLHQPQPQSPQYLRNSLHPRHSSTSYNILHDRPQSAMSLREHENRHGPHYPLYRLDHDHHHHHQLQSPIWPLTPDQEPEELLTPGVDGGSSLYHHHQHHLSHSILDDSNKSARSIYSVTSPADNGGGEQTAAEDSGQDKDPQEQGHANANTNTLAGPLGWLNASPLLDALIGWVEGLSHQPQLKKNEKPNPMLDIPFQFIALLTYPEPDPKLGNKMTLAMVRETAFVRQRRKTLLMLTLYTLVVRYCSFDFFLAVLFASNCGMLFLMKNSGRMNVTMAKRAVGQRVGWAKQWAGGLFRRGISGNGNHQGLEPGIQQQQQQQQPQPQQQGSTYSNLSPSKSMPSLSTSLTGGRIGTPSILGEKLDSIQDGNQQTRRRGLFGKKKAPTATTNNSNSNNNGNSVAHYGNSILASFMDGAGDDASVLTNRTQRRGFFKRNTTLATSASRSGMFSSATASDPTSLTKAFVPSILTTRPSTAMSTSPLSQTTRPTRSPSPSAMRKDSLQTQTRTNSPPTSGSSSSSSSPKAISTANITASSSVRSLASINPRSFLSGFSQSQKQPSSQASQASSQPTSTPSLLSHLKNSANVATAIAIPISSPQPVNASTAHSTFLSQSLTSSSDPMVVSMAGGGIVVFEDEIIEYSDPHPDPTLSHLPKFSSSPEPLVRQSSDNSSNCSGNGNGSVRSSSSSNGSNGSGGGSGIAHLDHRPQQLQLQLQHQDQQPWPKENNSNNNSNGDTTNSNNSSSNSGVALLIEKAKLKRMSSGLSFITNKDELDPVSSAAAEAMEGFDREA